MKQSFLLIILLIRNVLISKAYILIGNGSIYTVDETNPWVDAVAVDETEGIILAVGTEEDIRNVLGGAKETTYWDLNGRMLIPGFQDAHLHAVEAGINAGMCYIDEDADLYDIVPYYFKDPRFCANGGLFGDQGWIVGNGIDIALLEESVWNRNYEYPIDVLDKEYPNTPVLILDSLGHGAVVNTEAMKRVGFDTITGNPPGGKIDRDPTTGNPTGIVRENAQQKFRDAAFPPTAANSEVAYQSLLKALNNLAANGITTVSDAGGFWKQAQTESWIRAENEGKLTVRASNALYVYPDIPIDEQLADLTSRYSNDKSKLVRFNQAKIYVDGILSLLTSALKEPYDSSMELPVEDEVGFEYFGNAQTLQDVSAKLSSVGFQLHFHVTGDRAASIALDAIESIMANGQNNNNTSTTTTTSGEPQQPPRHRLTHCYLVDETDHDRFKELGVVADFQLAPSSLERNYEKFIATLIGSERASNLLPALKIHQAGGLVTVSSDWDADVLSPLTKLRVLLSTSSLRGDTILPDLATAIRMMTMNPAILLQQETTTGSIAQGKKADLVVLDRNIFDVKPMNIDKASVVATIFNGKLIFDPEGIFGDGQVGTYPPDDGSGRRPFSALASLVLGILGAIVPCL